MQLRIYAGMKPELEDIKSCQEALTKSLGFAEVNMEEGKVLRSGIISKELVKRILSSKGLPPELEEDVLRGIETFEVIDGKWLSFNFLDKKEESHRTLLGALYHAALYPHKETETTENIVVTTIAINTLNGVLCILTHAGKTAEEDFNEIIEKMSLALEARYVCEIVKLEDEDLIKLSKICLDEGNTVTASSMNTVEGRATFEHPTNIFRDPQIQQVNNILKIKRNIETGNWNYLIFRIIDPGYFLVISKSKVMKKRMTLYPIARTNIMDKSTAGIIFEDLINKISKVKKLVTKQRRLS
jgi:hypothetical protein